MRRHPSYPPGAAGTVIAAWRAIHPFIVSKFQFFILILLLMLLWFTSTSTSIFAYNEDGSPNWNGSGSSSGVRRRQHLRGGNRPLILVHSDSQPFVSYDGYIFSFNVNSYLIQLTAQPLVLTLPVYYYSFHPLLHTE